MKIKKVDNPHLEKIFLRLPFELYQHDKNWIAHLDNDIQHIFDKKKNKLFVIGKCERWILFNDKEKAIGKIAAFINPKYKNKGDTFKVGGFGFFDCINDQVSANLLFQTAENWLHKEGCEAMDGPINFGERDKFWGLLIKGFKAPIYGMNYNPPYYITLFENYGLQIFYEQLCYSIKCQKWDNPKLENKYQALITENIYRIEFVDKNKLKKYAKDFTEIYNDAWAEHGGNKTMNVKTAEMIMNNLKPILDNHISIFAYKENEPIGFFINIPDLNFYFKRFKGTFNLVNKIRLWLMLRFYKNPGFIGIVFGIKKEFQQKGIEALLIQSIHHQIKKLHYIDYEMQWIGSFNKKMINFASNISEEVSRKLATYRKIFDNKYPFHPHPLI